MFTDKFLSQKKLPYLSSEKSLGVPVKKAIFNVSVCQVSGTKITHKYYYTPLNQVLKTVFCSD